MKTIFLAAAAAAAALTAVAAPAAAQSWRQDRYEHPRGDARYEHSRGDARIDARQAQIQRTIDVARHRGALTRNELYGIQQEYREIARLEARYERNGLSTAEKSDLHRRLGHLELVVARDRSDREFAGGYRR